MFIWHLLFGFAIFGFCFVWCLLFAPAVWFFGFGLLMFCIRPDDCCCLCGCVGILFVFGGFFNCLFCVLVV